MQKDKTAIQAGKDKKVKERKEPILIFIKCDVQYFLSKLESSTAVALHFIPKRVMNTSSYSYPTLPFEHIKSFDYISSVAKDLCSWYAAVHHLESENRCMKEVSSWLAGLWIYFRAWANSLVPISRLTGRKWLFIVMAYRPAESSKSSAS